MLPQKPSYGDCFGSGLAHSLRQRRRIADYDDHYDCAGAGSCTVAPTETEGPFPTHTPSSYVHSDITDGHTRSRTVERQVVERVKQS
jgi:hypothetical protein